MDKIAILAVLILTFSICAEDDHKNNSDVHSHKFPKRTVKKGEPLKNQTICPVMGGAIDSTNYAIYKRNVIFFCCKGCITAFKKGEKYYLSVLKRFGEKPMYVKKRKKKK